MQFENVLNFVSKSKRNNSFMKIFSDTYNFKNKESDAILFLPLSGYKDLSKAYLKRCHLRLLIILIKNAMMLNSKSIWR